MGKLISSIFYFCLTRFLLLSFSFSSTVRHLSWCMQLLVPCCSRPSLSSTLTCWCTSSPRRSTSWPPSTCTWTWSICSLKSSESSIQWKRTNLKMSNFWGFVVWLFYSHCFGCHAMCLLGEREHRMKTLTMAAKGIVKMCMYNYLKLVIGS